MSEYCTHCNSPLSEAKQRRRAKYCTTDCRDAAAKERAEAREAAPEQEPASPYSQELAQAREDKRRRHEEVQEEFAEANKKRKKGTKSWLNVGNRFKRDLFAIPGMVNGKTDKVPGKYFRWIAPHRVEELLNKGWVFATREQVGDLTQKIVGTTEGLTSRVQRNEMFLMFCPESWKRDYDEYNELQAEAQEAELSEEALRAGLNNPRAGHFGKGQIPVRRLAHEKLMAERGED